MKYTYELSDDIKTKIEKVAKNIYGARSVIFTDDAKKQIEEFDKLNLDYPICIAKTQYSLSDDQNNLLCEEPFDIHVHDVVLKKGAEFFVVMTGKILTMPGLPKKPAAEDIDINDGIIKGIF